jgi:2-C-methyl-D-erythritol 4-phosphate cytidylyltransferase
LSASSQTEYALIVAGGKGTRIKSEVPKQFLEVAGLPILLHTINAFFQYDELIKVILVLPEQDIEHWNAIRKKFNFNTPIQIAFGGATRFQSVRNGLALIEGDGLVAIHDGVRPLVTTEMIAKSFRVAAHTGSAIASVPLKDSIRIAEESTTKALDRSRYRLIQTPQTFQVKLIKEAYKMAEDATLTDDASVAEHAGYVVMLFEGSYENLKITTPEDLVVAGALLSSRQQL